MLSKTFCKLQFGIAKSKEETQHLASYLQLLLSDKNPWVLWLAEGLSLKTYENDKLMGSAWTHTDL